MELLKKGIDALISDIESGLVIWFGDHYYINTKDKKRYIAKLNEIKEKL